jgi:hypothetical protein
MKKLLFLICLLSANASADVTCVKRGSLGDYQCDSSINVTMKELAHQNAIEKATSEPINIQPTKPKKDCNSVGGWISLFEMAIGECE